jgi:hypothetical protein
MDTTFKAVLCIALVAALADAIKRTWPSVWETFHIWLVLALGIVVVFLVGASLWAHTEIVNGFPLDKMNVASKIIAGLVIGAGSTVGVKVLDRIGDIGQERAKRPTHKYNAVGRPVAGTGLKGLKSEQPDQRVVRVIDGVEVGFPEGYEPPTGPA